jgi:hypothetical protein
VLLLCGIDAHGQARCPWLNVATASGVLEGSASLQIEQPNATETHCVFRYQNGKTVETLQIDVKRQQDISRGIVPEESSCRSPGTPLKAIGNEAVLCADDRRSSRGDQVIGRVRDSIFRVSASTTAKNDPAITREVLEQRAKDTAEQVAGALF